jgi:hypothetical protein
LGRGLLTCRARFVGKAHQTAQVIVQMSRLHVSARTSPHFQNTRAHQTAQRFVGGGSAGLKESSDLTLGQELVSRRVGVRLDQSTKLLDDLLMKGAGLRHEKHLGVKLCVDKWLSQSNALA